MLSGYWMNLGSLVMGLTAWGLGLAALFLQRRVDQVRLCALGSMALCSLSLCLAIFEMAHYADIEDASAFFDTAGAFRLGAGVLLAGTLTLNAAALLFRLRGRAD